jgi:hypothetical protein
MFSRPETGFEIVANNVKKNRSQEILSITVQCTLKKRRVFLVQFNPVRYYRYVIADPHLGSGPCMTSGSGSGISFFFRIQDAQTHISESLVPNVWVKNVYIL